MVDTQAELMKVTLDKIDEVLSKPKRQDCTNKADTDGTGCTHELYGRLCWKEYPRYPYSYICSKCKTIRIWDRRRKSWGYFRGDEEVMQNDE